MRWRFLLFVVIAAAIPPIAAFILTARTAATSEAELDQRLTAAASALQARLDADAARRHDLLLRLSLLPSIVEPVHQAAEAGQAPPVQALSRVEESLASLFPAESGDVDVVALATAQGAEAFFATEHAKTLALKVSDLPSAETALRGEWADSFQWFHGSLYRFSAAPIGIADAAIVIGNRVGNATTRGWRDRIRGDVSLVADGKVVGSSLKSELRPMVLGATARPNMMFASGTLDSGIPVPALRPYLPLFVRHVGAFRSLAADLHGAYSVVTIRANLGWIGMTQFAGLALGLGLLIVGFIWVQVVYGPVQRQARSIEAHLARLGAERGARLGTRGFGPPFLAIAELLDQLVEQWNQPATPIPRETPPQEGPRPIGRAMVELPLGRSPGPAPVDEPEGTPAFPFKDDPKVSGGRPALPNDAPSPLGAAPPRVTSTPPVAKAVVSNAPATPVIAGPRSGPRSAVSAPPSAPNSQPGRDSSIAPDLLARGSELEKELLDPPADPDEEHFRTVFDEFVGARERCGEPTEGLTFDRFTVRLRKNRDQLVEKYACKSVRFQVYVKDGKAAVKALPVR